MLIQILTKSLRSLGLFAIITFALLSIFCSMIVKDLDSSSFLTGTLTKFLNYTISFENRYYDFRMKSQLDPSFRSKDIVLVKIDDYSLEHLGVWPIPRARHGEMIDKLRIFGAKVVALDIFYPEKSPDYGGVSQDAVFAEALRNFQADGRRVFLAYTLADAEDQALPEAPVEMLNDTIQMRNVPEIEFIPRRINKYTFPIPDLVATEAGLGNITTEADPDGIYRNHQLVANIDTIYYGSLAMNAFQAFTGTSNTVKIFADATGELELAGKKMEIGRGGEVKIRYVGGENQFPNISLYDLLRARNDDPKLRKLLAGKMVFVGSTALGAHDLRHSPLHPKMPGVYSHMNMAHMLLHRHFYQGSNDSIKYSLILLCLGVGLFLFVQRLGNPFLDALVVIGIVTSSYYADKLYFLPEGYELKLFYCYFGLVACYTWNTFLKFYEANKEKKQIRGTFARYVAPTIVDEMLKNPDKLHVGGTKMDITCLFSDVRDFTKISEGLSATELAHSLNLYMGAMTDIVFDTKGTLDKYIGDAIVAIWGAPLPIGNHAQHAVEAAMKMMETLPAINEEFRRLGRPLFNVGIGLNSGECSVGNMGSSRIFSYTALGDNMNLGARLESLCKHYGAQILISQMTLERLDLTNIKTRGIDKVVVKGKTTAVEIHEVLHGHHWLAKDPAAYARYRDAYAHYQGARFSEALPLFKALHGENTEDKPVNRLLGQCRKFLESPELVTETFEVTVMTEK